MVVRFGNRLNNAHNIWHMGMYKADWAMVARTEGINAKDSWILKGSSQNFAL